MVDQLSHVMTGPQLYQMLAGLGSAFTGAQDRARKNEASQFTLDNEKRKRDVLAGIGDGPLDYNSLSRKFIGIGDLAGGTALAKLGMEQQRLAAAEKAASDAWGVISGSAGAHASSATPRPQAGAPIGGFDAAVNRTLQFEGGLNPRDTNGTPSNFGINQKANPNVDVRSLTPEGAKGIYKSQYWDAIGGDNLPPALAHVAFDTAVIAGPGKAKELIAQSGGDPTRLLDLREQFQNSLLQRDPEKYGPYAKAWSNRIAGLRADVSGGGQGQPQMAAQAPQPPQGPQVRDASGGFPVPPQAVAFMQQNPNTPALDVLTQAYGGDRQSALKALSAGGGNSSLSSGQFLALRGDGQGTRVAQVQPPGVASDALATGAVQAAGEFYTPGQPVQQTSGAPLRAAVAQAGFQPSEKALNITRLLLNPNLAETSRAPLMKHLEQEMAQAGGATPVQKNYWMAVSQGFQGTLMDYETALAKARATSVNLPGQEKTYDQETGKRLASNMAEFQKDGQAAQKQMNVARIMEKLIENPNFYSGSGAQAVTAFKKGMTALGIAPPDSVAPNELFKSLSNEMTLGNIGGSLGASISNSDRSFIEAIGTQDGTSKEGNKLIIEVMKRTANRKVEFARMAREYAAKHGGRLDDGFQDVLAHHAEAKPLFADLELPSQHDGYLDSARQSQQSATPRNPSPAQPPADGAVTMEGITIRKRN